MADEPMPHRAERMWTAGSTTSLSIVTWMMATRFWRSMVGEAGGSTGLDNALAERHSVGFGAEIMGRGKFSPFTGPWTGIGTDEEWRGWWGSNPPFHTPVFVLTHHPRPS